MLKNATWKTVLAWIIFFLFGVASWQLTMVFVWLNLPIRWWSFAILIIFVHTVLAFTLVEGVRFVPLDDKLLYRLAFLFCTSWGIVLWYQHPFAWAATTASGLGSFLGCLIATQRHFGFWEDNHPPPEAIRKVVFEKHIQIIGEPGRTPILKRIFDIIFSFVGLSISIPIWLFCIFVIWFEDPGPLYFVKNSVGKGGQNFHQYKLRTMVRGAEYSTGPVMAAEGDRRTLRFGRILRKTALDEIPQLFNILRGDMSVVGPRPQRTVLVYEYIKTMPEFTERHQVLPGLAGLAQVAGHYYISPRQKLRYDRIYTHHASLGFDLKLIGLAFLLVFYLRWKPDSADRIPRHWLH